MKIAVMIPTTKEIKPHILKDSLGLWETQDRKPDEIIVVDWDTLSNKEPCFSEARCCNVAINRTKCDYLAFTNVDIRPNHNVIAIIEEVLNKRPIEILQCARIDLPDGSDAEGIDWQNKEVFDSWAKRGKGHPAPGSLQVIPVYWLRKVNGFDERYYGWGYYDCEIIRRAAMDGLDTEWIDNSTTILHVPHELRRNNEKENQALFNGPMELIANKGKEWGKE